MALFRGKEILLIEDASDLQLQIRQVLEADGALVNDARTARSAMTALSETFPHLIVLDLGLAGSGALLFLAEMKKIPHFARIPILTLGKAREKEVIMRATQLGAADCLLKPFQATVLVQKVERLISVNPYAPRNYPPSQLPKCRVLVPAEIVTIGEGGFTIEAPAMLGCETEVRIDAPLLDQIGCSHATMRTTSMSPRPVRQGGYVNEINLLGIGPKVAKMIRTYLRSRTTEEGNGL
jgi:CheY-like chemotaxis protein